MKLFQIYYDAASKEVLDPDFIPLNNSASDRPDWFEYWPIRRQLLSHRFDDEDYVGFFSPRFKKKTGLSGSDVISRVERATTDIISFSPALEDSALFLNSFYHAERWHPGCFRLSQDFLDAAKIEIQLNRLVQDRSRIIFSNYFVAKYRFWKKWYELTDKLFQMSECEGEPLSQRLNAFATHRGRKTYQMKIFILERCVSLVLEMENIDAESGWDHVKETRYEVGPVLKNLLTLDALKTQYLRTGDKSFIGLYMKMQKHMLEFANRGPTNLHIAPTYKGVG